MINPSWNFWDPAFHGKFWLCVFLLCREFQTIETQSVFFGPISLREWVMERLHINVYVIYVYVHVRQCRPVIPHPAFSLWHNYIYTFLMEFLASCPLVKFTVKHYRYSSKWKIFSSNLDLPRICQNTAYMNGNLLSSTWLAEKNSMTQSMHISTFT